MGGCRLVVGLELIMVGRRIGHVAGVWQHLLVVESALGVVALRGRVGGSGKYQGFAARLCWMCATCVY